MNCKSDILECDNLMRSPGITYGYTSGNDQTRHEMVLKRIIFAGDSRAILIERALASRGSI